MSKGRLMMVQGLDRQRKEFTAFVLCNQEQIQVLEKAQLSSETFNLQDLNIIYTTAGHDIDAKTQQDIREYYQHLTGEMTH